MHRIWYCFLEGPWTEGGKSGSKPSTFPHMIMYSGALNASSHKQRNFRAGHTLSVLLHLERKWTEMNLDLSCKSRFMLCDCSPRQIHELRVLTALANAGEAVAIDRATQAPHTRPRKMALLDDGEGETSSERTAQRKSQSVRCDCWDSCRIAWESTAAGLHVVLFELTLHDPTDWKVQTVSKRVDKLSRRKVGGHFQSSILDLKIHINIWILSISYDHTPWLYTQSRGSGRGRVLLEPSDDSSIIEC